MVKWILLLLTASVSAFAQPVVATNVIKLTPQTRLAWDALSFPDISGYNVQMSRGTNVWRSFTTNSVMPIIQLNPNPQSGTYLFSVSGVNKDGLEGDAGTLTTNLSQVPSIVVNIRVEVFTQ